jgi:ATP-binding protein involved in chromosome partitioning
MIFGKKDKLELPDSDRKKLMEALAKIQVPHFNQDLVTLDWVGAFSAQGTELEIELEFPTLALLERDRIENEVKTAAKAVLGDDWQIELRVLSNVKPAQSGHVGKEPIAGIQNVVLVASGKGGVGKSTLAMNLATALAKEGCKVGLLDADVYGPSVPTMAGVAPGSRPGTVPGADPSRPQMIPLQRHGVKLMSIGFLVDTSTAMVWRGPMIASASMQMFRDVAWGELDYLIVDLPPGTGDIHLTIAQQVVVTGSVIVSTPQDVALADVIRAKGMFDKVDIPCLGLIENMSYFICDGCDKRHEIFDNGGAEKSAEELDLPFLGAIPIEQQVRVGGDEGVPAVLNQPESASARALTTLAQEVATRLAVMAEDTEQGFSGPTISIQGTPTAETAKPKSGLPIIS